MMVKQSPEQFLIDFIVHPKHKGTESIRAVCVNRTTRSGGSAVFRVRDKGRVPPRIASHGKSVILPPNIRYQWRNFERNQSADGNCLGVAGPRRPTPSADIASLQTRYFALLRGLSTECQDCVPFSSWLRLPSRKL